MRTTPCAWSVLLAAGVALWATALRGPSEQQIREVLISCLQGVVNMDRAALERAGDRTTYVDSVKAGEEAGEVVYPIPIDALFDRWTPVMTKMPLAKVQSADAVDGKTEAVKFELDLNEGKYIDCLFLYKMHGGWRIANKILVFGQIAGERCEAVPASLEKSVILSYQGAPIVEFDGLINSLSLMCQHFQ